MKFNSKQTQVSEDNTAPITGWSIDSVVGGEVYTLQGRIYTAEAVRYVDALAAGLRAAGFDAKVTLISEARVMR